MVMHRFFDCIVSTVTFISKNPWRTPSSNSRAICSQASVSSPPADSSASIRLFNSRIGGDTISGFSPHVRPQSLSGGALSISGSGPEGPLRPTNHNEAHRVHRTTFVATFRMLSCPEDEHRSSSSGQTLAHGIQYSLVEMVWDCLSSQSVQKKIQFQTACPAPIFL